MARITQHFKNRVRAAKPYLPKYIVPLIIDRFPEYSNKAWLVRNVLSGGSSDIRLTEIIESIAAERGYVKTLADQQAA